MRRIQLFIILSLAVSSLAVWAVAYHLSHAPLSKVAPLPTLAVLASVTASDTPTLIAIPSETPTATVTLLPSPTSTATSTATFTATPTLSTRVLEISAVMPGIYIPPTATDFPFGTILLPAPPEPIEPLPDATQEPPPYSGWYSFESDHPLVQYSTPWQARQIAQASCGQYHRSENVTSYLTFPFEGEGLRIRYVAARNMGIFDVVVDGEVIDTVDGYAPDLSFPGTQVYFVGSGTHTLTIRSAQKKHSQSDGYVVGLDAIQVFRGSENMLIMPPSESLTPSQVPQPAVDVELVAAPSRQQPTATPVAAGQLTASVVVAYDENGNRAVDPAEGVAGISVRVVEVGTNRVMAQAVTDAQGFAQLQVITSADVQLVVPYFGKVWSVTQGRGGNRVTSFTLLLEPGNQPGLIP